MARLALAASVLLSLFLLSLAHRLHPDLIPSTHATHALSASTEESQPDLTTEADALSASTVETQLDLTTALSAPTVETQLDLTTEADALSAPTVESQPDLTTEADALSASTVESQPAAIRLPSDKPSDESATVQVATTPFPTFASIQVETIEPSLIPIPIRRDFPHPRVVSRSFWRRPGRHCHHLHRGPHGGIPRGVLIPYGNDMIVPSVHARYKDGRLLSRGAFPDGHHHPMMMEEIPVEDLAKQREMGLPREMRPFRRFRPEGDGHEGEDGLVKRFLDFLNRH